MGNNEKTYSKDYYEGKTSVKDIMDLIVANVPAHRLFEYLRPLILDSFDAMDEIDKSVFMRLVMNLIEDIIKEEDQRVKEANEKLDEL